MLLLSACGSEEASVKGDDSQATEQKAEKAEKNKPAAEKRQAAKENNGKVLNPYIAEESEGKVEVVYTNTKPNYTFDMNGFKVSVDQYQIVRLSDIHKDYTYVFDDQPDGYVITAQVTLDNQVGKPMYYTPMMHIRVANEYEIFPGSSTMFVDDKDKVFSKKETEAGKYAKDEKVTGFFTFALTNDEYQSMSSVNPKFVIEGGAVDNADGKGASYNDATFDFIISDEQKSKLASQPNFYQDELLLKDMAQKKMIFEKQNIADTKELNGVKITLDGIQYTEVIPTEAYKEAFADFGDSGIVAITMSLLFENQSQEPISAYWTSPKINIDETRATLYNTSQLEPEGTDEIKPGEKGERLAVFLLRKDEFGIYKKFDLEVGPLRNMENADVSKGYTVTFSLPRE